MVRFLYNRVITSGWIISQTPDNMSKNFSGVLMRKSRGVYITAPAVLHPNLVTAVEKLNATVAFTMQTGSIDIILHTLEDFQTDLLMKDGSLLQVLGSLQDISKTNVKKYQYCCLLRQERMVLVWYVRTVVSW